MYLRKLLTVNVVDNLWCNTLSLFFFFCVNFSQAYTQCPKVQSLLVDACGKESQDEFIVINSGTNGFSMSNLQLDFDANNNIFGSQNNDIHINHGNNPTNPIPCDFIVGDVSLVGGCINTLGANDGDYIPPNSILVIQLGSSASQIYDFSALCGMGECIYVTKNSCERTLGAFSNVGAGERTLVVSLSDGSGCAQAYTYDRNKIDVNDGAYFAPALTGNMQYGNMGCAVPPIADFPLPPIAFAGKDTSLCIKESMVVHLNGDIGGSAISAMWNGGMGDFNDVQLLDAEYYPTDEEIASGKVLLTLTTNDLSGGVCPWSVSTIQVDFDSLSTDIQLVNEFDGYGLACPGDSNGVIKALVFDGMAPYDFNWNVGANKSINSDLLAGEYRVLVVDAMGCLGTSSVQLTEPERINTSWKAFPEGCNGNLGKVIVDNIDGGIGPFDLFLDDTFQNSQNWSDTYQKELSAGVYQLVVMDKHQCVDTVAFVIDEGYQFEVDLGPDIIIPQGKEVTVELNYDDHAIIEDISWTIDSLLGCFNCETLVRAPLFSERVEVEVRDSNGCVTSDVMYIYVEDAGLYVPNIFSPNNDGINDYFSIFLSDEMANVEYFTLFDGSGNKIVYLHDVPLINGMNIWDGYYKGELLKPQVFMYQLEVTFTDNRIARYQGSITLVR